MPRQDKKKKKSKKSLSTADILKLLKKLKPKTQQIVKVNIGDQERKKKKGDVQSSYNPPYVFPQKEFPAITSLGQPPYQPPFIEQSRQASTFTTQPERSAAQLMPPPPSRISRAISSEAAPRTQAPPPRISDISESESEVIELFPRSSRASKGYTVRAPSSRISGSQQEASSFGSPRIFNSSSLSTNSAQPIYFNLPVQNDRFQADIIRTDSSGDQIGTLANSLPSELWSNTPQGDVPLSPEEIQAQNAANEGEKEALTPSEVFAEEPSFEEAQQEQIESASPVEAAPKETPKIRPRSSIARMIDTINLSIKNDGFPIENIPQKYLATRGVTKGLIKSDYLKTGMTTNEVTDIFNRMNQFLENA